MGVSAGNATDAAKRAGYSARTAYSAGSRLLKDVEVQRAIKIRVDRDPTIATREHRQQFWSDVMNGVGKFKKTPMKERLKASELLGKSQADFIERHEHGGPDGKPLELRVTFGGRYKAPQEARGKAQ